jgi:hypothetical protein
VRKLAGELDPQGLVERQRAAEKDRRVTTRPAPDTMAYLTALLPAAAAIACRARLATAAEALIAAGDSRNRDQIMADLLVDAVTGRKPIRGIPTHDDLDHVEDLADLDPDDLHRDEGGDAGESAEPGQPNCTAERAAGPGDFAGRMTGDEGDVSAAKTGAQAAPARPFNATASHGGFVPLGAHVGVDIKLVMTDLALFGSSDEPAHLEGYGPVPAAWVRNLLSHSDATVRVFIRRLFTDPDTGALAGVESRRREFTGALRALILARDQFCRAPWCGAPIRHIDHVVPYASGGPTSLANAQGLCEACNHAKQAPGWRAETDPDHPGVVHTHTPTGHRYTSRPPDPPGKQFDARGEDDTHARIPVAASPSPEPNLPIALARAG